MLASATAIASLRVRAAIRDGVALQQAIDRQLQGAELAPTRLPPSALLIVRRLADPLPGRLGADPRRLRPPRRWTEALRERLDLLLANAQRPVDGISPATAEAILFADPAELVACLVLDLVRGTASQHWWWQRIRVLLPELALPADGGVAGLAPAAVLRGVARELPAVFAYLGQWRAAVTVASVLAPQDSRELLALLAASHGVDRRVIGVTRAHPEFPVADATDVAGEAMLSGVRGEAAPSAAADTRPPGAAVPVEPWLPWLPGSVGEAVLGAEQRCLVGLALALHRVPAMVRQDRFTRRAWVWWGHRARTGRFARGQDASGGGGHPGDRPGTASGASWQPAGPILIAPRSMAADDSAGPGWREPDSVEDAGDPAGYRARARSMDPDDGAAQGVSPRDDDSAQGPNTAAGGAILNARGHESAVPTGDTDSPGLGGGHGPMDAPAAPRRQGQQPTQPGESYLPVFSGEQFPTALGGVLYLIHALEDLEIPGAFEADWRLVSHPGPWGVLDLIARSLLGERLTEVAEDPLWQVLAALAAADGGAAGGWDARAGMVADETDPPRRPGGHLAGWWSGAPAYRAPSDWWRGLTDGERRVRWASAAGRLWLWSERGFLLASVPRDARHPLLQANAELGAWAGESGFELAPGDPDRVPLAAAVGENSSRWATAATPAVAQRLLLSLGIEEPDSGTLHRLLSVSGTLYLSATHVDLLADLEQIWLPARRAGLDRSPGWLADHGRVVLFHFR